MDIKDYFNIISTDHQVLHFYIKDFWSDDVIKKFGDQILELFKNAVDTFNQSKFLIIADLREAGSPPESAKEIQKQMMVYALEHGLFKAVDIIPKVILKMGINSIANSTKQKQWRSIVSNMTEAKQLIAHFKMELN